MPGPIRFGIGWPDGLQSTTYRVWSEADSSIYVVNRSIGRSYKTSLHQNEYGHGYTEVYEAEHGTIEGGRKVEVWNSEENRLEGAPIREGYAVILGRFSMGLLPPPANEDEVRKRERWLERVEWIQELPPMDHAWQFTIIASDPGVRISPPGTRSMAAIPVGELRLPNGGNAWVMRHLVRLDDSIMENLKQAGQAIVNEVGEVGSHSVYRGQVHFKSESGLRWSADVAITYKADPDLMAQAERSAGI